MKRWPAIRVRDWDAGDAAKLLQVFDGMSDQSRYQRYHSPVHRLSAGMLRALLAVDGDRHVALIAEARRGQQWVPAGIGRFIRTEPATAEIAIEVADAFHRQGIGAALLRALRTRALTLGYTNLVAEVLAENRPMLGLLRREFPAQWYQGHGPAVTVICPLAPEAATFTADDVLLGAA